MANHKSAIKRIRANATKRLRNRYQARTTRNAIKRLRSSSSKSEASELLKKVASMKKFQITKPLNQKEKE